MSTAIWTEGLTKDYGAGRGLVDLDLEVAAGSHSAADWSWLSPFALYDRTTVVAPGGRFDVPATAALVVAAAVIAAFSAAGFRLRDVGAPLLGRRRARRRSVRMPSANPLLRVPVLSALWEQRLGLLAWLLGSAVLAAFLLSIATSTNEMLRSTPSFQGYFRAGGTDDPALLLVSLFWFGLAAFMMAVYATTQAGRWAADDAEGRLEMTITQPVPRWRVVAERGLTLTAASALIAAAGTLVVAGLAPSQGIHLRADRLLLATAMLVPLALSFGALGAAIIARLPRLALPVLAATAVAGYFLQQLGPLVRWPGWALDLSLFQLYGNPLISGVFWTGLCDGRHRADRLRNRTGRDALP